ncbi:hypothetical protein Rhe02_64480 [Rhizocola hellebori]|uniref:Uncharacterized protein n=2 Tax=Rhizocola hellebori TaxID=1392758 RepID=A0A8J3VJT3_9ACTN|nr:hypothetical protein Rhe02_64480 [Rhizocola hellebori]
MVLAGALLGVLIVVYSCNVSGKTSPAAEPSKTPTAASKPASSPSPTAQAAMTPAAVVSPTATVAVAAADMCTDAEISVKAVPAKTTIVAGTDVQITLLIKNISNRSCSRDVGADQQELRVVLGTEKIWSSDDCDGPTGTELRTFPPNHERSYNAMWNGESSTKCSTTAKRTPTGPAPEPGEYQLIGRVGTDKSDPVTLKIT